MTRRASQPARGGRGLTGRLHHLKMLHERLQLRIDIEAARPSPDEMALQTMKRQKLKTKDEIALIAGMLDHVPGRHTENAA